MKGNHIMVDIETLGQSPTTPVISVGAVLFNKEGILQEKEWFLDVDEQIKKGRRVDWSTVQWWMSQSDEARKKLQTTSVASLETFFFDWDKEFKASYKIWGNGSDFDISIMSDLWKRHSVRPIPWKFWDVRCFRTLNAMTGCKDKVMRQGTHHSAIDDARFQAQAVIWALNNGIK